MRLPNCPTKIAREKNFWQEMDGKKMGNGVIFLPSIFLPASDLLSRRGLFRLWHQFQGSEVEWFGTLACLDFGNGYLPDEGAEFRYCSVRVASGREGIGPGVPEDRKSVV